MQSPASRATDPRHETRALWHVRLLGRFELSDGVRTHSRLATRAMTILLARLALWPSRDHPREELAELIWPGIDLRTGLGRLRQTLSLLRNVLEPAGRDSPVLLADRLNLRLVPGRLDCDALLFEAACRQSRATGEAVVYGGDLLPAFYDDWVLTERARFEALNDRLPEDCRPDPWSVPRDAGSTALPPIDQGAGKPRADALLPPACRLPVYLTRCFIDDSHVALLRRSIDEHSLVTLVGPGGSGKTRLAVEAVQGLDARSTRGAGNGTPTTTLFVRMISARTRDETVALLCAELRIEGPDPGLHSVVQRLSDAPFRVVLDNVEQLEPGAQELLEQLAAALPRVRWLLTSRRSLGLDGETLFPIAAMALPRDDASLAVAASNPAIALFVDRASAVRSGFHLGARNVRPIARLVAALEGMPLAIELAASRVRSFSPAEMLVRLAASPWSGDGGQTPQLDLLTRAQSRDDQRHASMARTVAWSWNLLDEAQRALLGAMTVFVGGCSAEMLETVQDGQGDVHAGLESLLTHSLIRSTTIMPANACESLRFHLYEPIREYATTRFDAVQRSRWQARHLAWALAWARALPATPSLADMRAELPNLAIVFETAARDGAAEDAVDLLLALARSFQHVELPAAALAYVARAVEACARPGLQSRGRTALAPLLFDAGLKDEALRHAAVGLASVPDDPAQRGTALHVDALLRWRSDLRNPRDVLPAIDEAVALSLRCADAHLQASLLSLRASVVGAQAGGAQPALALYRQALAHWMAHGNRHAVNLGRYNLAIGEFHCGRRDFALAQFDIIAAEARLLDDWRRLIHVECARGNVLEKLRRWPEAAQAYRTSLRLAWRSMAINSIAFALWNLPSTLARIGQPASALASSVFAALFWQKHIGPLSTSDHRELHRIERVAACGLDMADRAAAIGLGQRLTLAEAVDLALGD